MSDRRSMVSGSLVDFLRLGTIGDLGLGSPMRQVSDLLGRPDTVSVKRPPIWKYQDLQITFVDGIAVHIGLYPGPTLALPAELPRLDLDGLRRLDSARVWLGRHGVEVERDDATSLEDGSQEALRAPSGARLYYLGGELDSIQLATWTRDRPAARTPRRSRQHTMSRSRAFAR